ncbi:hypothetical protein ACFFMN_23370 [Planobispora siamensis]|uniref:Uncharacterized protein n=1 Tax=Planobispora siamensis TaxID=936338 RepID=A0A8J3SN01_9ACTN|nr:hypothetical protein [Planobispora siamensis]GIH95304.1 hypothetical protein Psi01_59340 [Planobispora siamensis]
MATTAAAAASITISNVDKPGRQWRETHPATLSPIDPGHGLPTVYLVTVPEITARFYGCRRMADRVIGGITRVRNGWAVVAYRDREGFLFRGGVGYYLPIDATSRAQAVRMLLTYWHTDFHPDRRVEQITDRDWRRL